MTDTTYTKVADCDANLAKYNCVAPECKCYEASAKSTCDTACSNAPPKACTYAGVSYAHGKTRCEGTMIRICSNGAWFNKTDCNTTGQVCSAGVCVNGTPKTFYSYCLKSATDAIEVTTDKTDRSSCETALQASDDYKKGNTDGICFEAGSVDCYWQVAKKSYCENNQCNITSEVHFSGATCARKVLQTTGKTITCYNTTDCDGNTCGAGSCVINGTTYTDGQYFCDGNNVKLCSHGQVIQSRICDSSTVCKSGNCEEIPTTDCKYNNVAYSNNQYFCDGNTVRQCRNKITYHIEGCTSVQTCVAGACKTTAKQCTDGVDWSLKNAEAIGCKDSNTKAVCDGTTGLWKNVTACGTGFRCTSGTCIAIPTTDCKYNGYTYTNGQKFCSGSMVLVCNNTVVSTYQTCTSTQTCLAGSCVNNTKQCTDGVDGIKKNAGVIGCKDSNTKAVCDGNTGLWGNVTACGTGYRCSSGTCVALPTTDCSYGGYIYATGQRFCGVNNNVLVCNNTVITAIAICGSNETCRGGICEENPSTDCNYGGVSYKDGDKFCEGNVVKQCSNTIINTAQVCSGNETCNNGNCVAIETRDCSYNGVAYKDEQKFCEGNTVQQCQNKEILPIQYCNQYEICENGACIEKPKSDCVENGITYKDQQKVCAGKEVHQCQDGTMYGIDTCATNQDCTNGVCVLKKCQQCPAGMIEKIKGNANCDNKVDLQDFENWRYEKYDVTDLDYTWTADFDCDSAVGPNRPDMGDYMIWLRTRNPNSFQ